MATVCLCVVIIFLVCAVVNLHVLQKEDTDWVKKCMEYKVDGARPRGRPNRIWREVVEKDCQARKLNKEDAMDCSRWFCSLAVLDPRVGHTMDILSVILIDSSMGSPDYVLILSIQAMHGLHRLRAPGINPCIIFFSRQLPCFLIVWPWYVLASLLPLICFLSVHETHPFTSKASRRVSSCFLRVQLSQPYIATGHTSTFISRIFVEIGMLWLFHIFCSDAPITCPLFNLVRNSVVHSPSSVVRHPRYRNVSTCSSCSFWMSMWHTMPSLAITLVLSTLMSRLYLQLTRSRRSTNSCSSASKVTKRMMSSAKVRDHLPSNLQSALKSIEVRLHLR